MAAGPPSPEVPPAQADDRVRRPTDWVGDDSVPGVRRAEEAAKHKGAEVERLFAEAGVTYPPAEVFLRIFKQDRELEVWASSQKDAAMSLIATYETCAMSGKLGPKRREGDKQVPEGFYRIEYFWPDSAFYLAAKVSYPNALDRALGGAAAGSDIMIHGGCASIGCIAMSDERIEEIFLMGTSAHYRGRPVHVHVFPGRDMKALLEDPSWQEHHAFWENLREGLEAFERTKRVPTVATGRKGLYEVKANGA